MNFDLLTTVEYGGCSAKLSAAQLSEALKDLPRVKHKDLLVDIDTHDDAGVYRINDQTAIIQTLDFFPPICSDPYEFGQIAAANALSDVYAMGGQALTAMNIVMFPSSKIPLDVLAAILKGGHDKVAEAGALIVGGHTIDDYPPKYGLSVTGVVHPEKIITNADAKEGDILILAKPIGTGIIISGQKLGEIDIKKYSAALESMKLLNKKGAELMQEAAVRSATDITGFSLLGHALKMAQGSGLTFRIDSATVPLFDGAYDLVDLGCIPGACFRNLEFVGSDCTYSSTLDYNLKMILHDAQTSGGLFMAVSSKNAQALLDKLRTSGYPSSSIVGEVLSKRETSLIVE